MDIVGGAAAAARLRQNERDLMDVILAGFDRVHQLADDQQGRIAGVVMHVAQTLLRDVRAFGMQQLHVVAVVFHQAAHQAELDRQHIGYQDGIILAHFLGELRPLRRVS